MINIRVRVGAVIIEDNKILLVEHRKDGLSYWLLPGGGVEASETLHEALIRELKEELSMDSTPSELLFVCESINSNRHILHLYFKTDLTAGILKVNPDERLADAKYFSVKEVKELYLRPDIQNILIELLENPEEFTPGKYYGNLWH